MGTSVFGPLQTMLADARLRPPGDPAFIQPSILQSDTRHNLQPYACLVQTMSLVVFCSTACINQQCNACKLGAFCKALQTINTVYATAMHEACEMIII